MNYDDSIRTFPDEPEEIFNKTVWDTVPAPLKRSFPKITSFQTKVLYVFGMIRHMFEAAGYTFEINYVEEREKNESPDSFLFATYLLASGAVELMGRCILHSSEWNSEYPIRSNRPLVRGLEWCSTNPSGFDRECHEPDLNLNVVTVDNSQYSVQTCKNFRNYLAHGAAFDSEEVLLTPDFVKSFMNQTCKRIDNYYSTLFDEGEKGKILRERLAISVIEPFEDPNGIIHVEFLYKPLFTAPYGTPCGKVLYQKSWRVT